MRGRGDGDGLGDRVDAVGAAGGQDRREAVLPHVRAEVPGVEVHVIGAPLLHAARDALGDDVAGRQLGQLVLTDHEAHAVGVHQMRALAPHRLGDQRLLALGVGAEEEHGGVELHELQVGDLGARAQGERDAVAGGDGRIGGRGEDLAHAAGGEDHRGGVDGPDAVVLALSHDVQGDTGGAALGVGEEVEDQGVLHGRDVTRAYRLDEGAGDLRAGRVAARVDDAAAVVAALAGQLYGALGPGVEVGAGLDEAAHGAGTLRDESAHGLLVAEAHARHEGVVQVLSGGVALAERRGDPALRPARGTVVQAGLGHHDRPQTGGGAAQGGGQSGHSGADDHDIGVQGPAGRGGVQPYSGGTHMAAPKVSGMLSISRVEPTLAATARTASPVWPGRTSVKSAGSTSAT